MILCGFTNHNFPIQYIMLTVQKKYFSPISQLIKNIWT